MHLLPSIARLLTVCCLSSAGAWAAGASATRGQLLYDTHCIACHSTQMHWRDQRRVEDWSSLLGQVGQWQAREQLNWTLEDIEAVARHLDRTVYRLGDAPARGE